MPRHRLTDEERARGAARTNELRRADAIDSPRTKHGARSRRYTALKRRLNDAIKAGEAIGDGVLADALSHDLAEMALYRSKLASRLLSRGADYCATPEGEAIAKQYEASGHLMFKAVATFAAVRKDAGGGTKELSLEGLWARAQAEVPDLRRVLDVEVITPAEGEEVSDEDQDG